MYNNCMKRILITSLLLLAAPTVALADADSDFAARCGAAGVVKCEGFDTSDSRWHPVSGRMAVDTATKVSGTGALRFLAPAGETGANISGNWDDILGTSVQTGTFYVQYRVRFDQAMLTNAEQYWDSSWKVSLFYGHSSTCQTIELTTINKDGTGRAGMYYNCGNGLFVTPGTNNFTGTTPQAQQQGETPGTGFSNCVYNTFTNCFIYPPDTWITLYFKVVRGTSSTQVQAWKSVGGEAYQQWINVANVPIGSGGDPFDRIMLTPYMTGLSTTAPTDAHMWFDELIVSTQSIAVPTEGTDTTPPAAPSGLAAQ